MIKSDLDVDLTDILIRAIYKGDVAAIRQAVESGADVTSPVIWEYKMKYLTKDVVEIFLDNGLSLNATYDDMSLLECAVYEGTIGVVKLLLSRGLKLDPNHRDALGDSLLHHAVRGENYENIEFLLQNGFCAFATNKFKENPLDILFLNMDACVFLESKERLDIIKLLCKYQKRQAKNLFN